MLSLFMARAGSTASKTCYHLLSESVCCPGWLTERVGTVAKSLAFFGVDGRCCHFLAHTF
jgi:hypothetical protein